MFLRTLYQLVYCFKFFCLKAAKNTLLYTIEDIFSRKLMIGAWALVFGD
jgi:hypothetical protein